MKASFCSSPWFHIRIAPDGGFLPCRWANRNLQSTHNIRDTSISEYMNSTEMMDMRMSFLSIKIFWRIAHLQPMSNQNVINW